MKCKYCQAEMEENVTICPACGKEQETGAAAEVETVEEVVTEEVAVEEIPAAEEAPETEETPVAEETPAEQEPAAEIKEGVKATPGKIALAIAAGVVVLALLVAMVISSLVGTVVPMFFHKIKVDPAVASGPLITTVNDLVAVITYYGLAWVLLLNVVKAMG